jgi:hypothetical protein
MNKFFHPTNLYREMIMTPTDEDMTEPLAERYIRFQTSVYNMPNSKRDMYVCFSNEEIVLLENFARNKGALNISQALESLAKERNNEN